MSVYLVSMKILHGTTRITFLIGRWAIKVPMYTIWKHFLIGLLGNMQERDFCKMDPERMMPVKFCCPGGFFLIMPRADPLPREVFFNLDYDEYVKACIPVENKLDSFGMYQGRIVAIDYGS